MPTEKDPIKAALLAFVQTIEDTGGVTEHTGADDGGPATDPEWLDLGDAYRDACAALSRPIKWAR